MRCEEIAGRLADHLAGTLTEAERAQVDEHLRACEACREELEGLSAVWGQLGRIPAAEPDSRAMRAKFDAMLAAERQAQPTGAHSSNARSAPPAATNTPAGAATEVARRAGPAAWRRGRRFRTLQPLFQAVAAAVLIVIGIQMGRQMAPAPTASPDVTGLRQEVRDLRQMVTLSLMQQQSASERLKGVSWSNQLDRPGNEVVTALIDTLMHDSNVNVRLASIDALKRFAERETVRAAAIHALDTQTSPLVQMALIDFVVETQEREALVTLRRLAQDKQINEAVRTRASWGIDHLEAA